MSAVLDRATLAAQARKAVLAGTVAEWPEPDPQREQVAIADPSGGRGNMVTVANLSDEQLATVLNGTPRVGIPGEERDGVMGLLQMIEKDAAELGVTLNEVGLPERPVPATEQPSVARDSVARRLNRHTLQARAVGQELFTRDRRDAENAADKRERSRALLQQVLDAGPAQAVELVNMAGEIGGAVERLRQLALDLELAASGPKLWHQHEHIRDAVAVAAGALSRPMPELADMPAAPDFDGLLDYVLPLLLGRDGGELLRTLRLPDMRDVSRVSEAARVLRGDGPSRR